MDYNKPVLHGPILPQPGPLFYYPGLTKTPSSNKPRERGVTLPGAHSVPGPGPGASSQPSGRSFAAALRNLAKQAGPLTERDGEAEPRQGSPKQPRGPPPPLVRGPSPSNNKQPLDKGMSCERSGFQPYRPEEGRMASLGPNQMPGPAYSPLDYAAYHHSLFPPHIQHAYRLEEQLYLERCGMPLFPSYPAAALYGLMPSPLGLLTPAMHERLKLEEEHRHREQEREREKEKERDKREKTKRSPRASPSHSHEPSARKATISQPAPAPPPFVRPFEDNFPAPRQNHFPYHSEQHQQLNSVVKSQEQFLNQRDYSTSPAIPPSLQLPTLVENKLPNSVYHGPKQDLNYHSIGLKTEYLPMNHLYPTEIYPSVVRVSEQKRVNVQTNHSKPIQKPLPVPVAKTKTLPVRTPEQKQALMKKSAKMNHGVNNLLSSNAELETVSSERSESSCVDLPPPVLNIPNPSRVMSSLNNHQHTLWHDYRHSTKVLSRLDLAERKRGWTKAEEDEDDWDYNPQVFLTKGPPDKLDAPPRKLRFLAIFGLTTLARRNELEVRKLARRCAVPTVELAGGEAGGEALPLSLPHPSLSPRSIHPHSPDKLAFFLALALQPMSRTQRQEREEMWQEVLAERRRRQRVTPLVVYCCQDDRHSPTPPIQLPLWPGLDQLIAAYHTYSAERSSECHMLRVECARWDGRLVERREQAGALEKRLQELQSLSGSLRSERDQIQQSLDSLTTTFSALRNALS